MDLFDVIGPVMIGPSSSHTAGAARIGRVARKLLQEPVLRAEVGFFGSFAKTWRGHGTDRAIVGGLLNMEVDDVRIRDSLQIAKEKGVSVSFSEVTLRDAHPNTVTITATGERGTVELEAASIGGGLIRIEGINGLSVSFSGNENTLIVFHRDVRGTISETTGIVSRAGVNIATMHVFRKSISGDAIMVLELDALPGPEVIVQLNNIEHVYRCILLERS